MYGKVVMAVNGSHGLQNNLLIHIFYRGQPVWHLTLPRNTDVQRLRRKTMLLVDDRLYIHLGKTESILFGTKKRLGISSEMNVTCGKTMVASTKSVRYLGVDLDQSLDGNYIAENILKRGNS